MPVRGPEVFNAADYLVHHRITAGEGDRVALVHPGGELTYAEVSERVHAVAVGLAALGVHSEEWVMFFAADSPEFAHGIGTRCSLTEDELVEFCRTGLAAFKRTTSTATPPRRRDTPRPNGAPPRPATG